MPDEPEFVELVTVATFLTPADAELARNALEAAGFHVLAKDISTVYADGLLSPMLGGVRLQVPPEEAQDAAEFLQAAEDGTLAPEVPCPSCGVAEQAVIPPTDASDPAQSIRFRCRACGHEWA
jgi:hypothetical protein